MKKLARSSLNRVKRREVVTWGRYDPTRGCGFEWSNTIVVAEKSGYRMSRVPYSQEWCWLKL